MGCQSRVLAGGGCCCGGVVVMGGGAGEGVEGWET